eukprot:8456956-Pyramimonas_sp.AAC.1
MQPLRRLSSDSSGALYSSRGCAGDRTALAGQGTEKEIMPELSNPRARSQSVQDTQPPPGGTARWDGNVRAH